MPPALSHGWWKGWKAAKPLTDEFRDRGRGFNVLSFFLGAEGMIPLSSVLRVRDKGQLRGRRLCAGFRRTPRGQE